MINDSILKTDDGGLTWRYQHRPKAPIDLTLRSVDLLDIHFKDALHGVISASWGMMYKTDNGGNTWQVESLGTDASIEAIYALHNYVLAGAPLMKAMHYLGNEKDESVVLQGRIGKKTRVDCVPDPASDPVPGQLVLAEPGPFYSTTGDSGTYDLYATPGAYSVRQIFSAKDNLLKRQVCPADLAGHQTPILTYGDTLVGLDFVDSVISCPFLTVSIGSNRRRRCMDSYTTLQYCNQGFASASNVAAHIKLPSYISLVSASHPYTFNAADSSYTFQIGTLEAGHCGSIQIVDHIACVPLARNLTVCTKAWITPGNPVAPSGCVPSPVGYDGSDITITNIRCQGAQLSEPVFAIKNRGLAMSAARQYRVYFDSLLVYAHSYQLGAGDSLVFIVPRTVQQWQDLVRVRVEAEQDPNHPYATLASSLDYCFLTRTGGTRSSEGGYFAPDDESPVVDVDCQQIRDSYDPNDKAVSPKGISAAGNVRPGTMLDYKIRFQNTGTDTAYTVRIEDTLSVDLDLSTLELGASSHPYQFSVSGKGRPALKFTFNNINLVDSVTNEAKSHGFVSFRIRPSKEAPIGTRIENEASIYFDFNDPVLTNSTMNTIHLPTITPGVLDSVQIVAVKAFSKAPKVSIVPNPSKDAFTIQVAGLAREATVEVLSVTGTRMAASCTKDGQARVAGLSPGLYLVRVEGLPHVLKAVVER